jgi:hypothetical protein
MRINVFIFSVVFFGNSLFANSQFTINPTLNPIVKPSLNPIVKPSLNPSLNPIVKPSLNHTLNPFFITTPSLLNTTTYPSFATSSNFQSKSSNNSDKKKVNYLLSIILPCVLGPLFLLSILFIYVKYFISFTKRKEYVITSPISPDEPTNDTIISTQNNYESLPNAV